jgi:hypothetical protein
MLNGSYFFECECGSDEHTLRFTLDTDPQEPGIFTTIFLSSGGFRKRANAAIKYLFGYKCQYGHWECWSLRPDDAKRLRNMLDDFIAATSGE